MQKGDGSFTVTLVMFPPQKVRRVCSVNCAKHELRINSFYTIFYLHYITILLPADLRKSYHRAEAMRQQQKSVIKRQDSEVYPKL